MVIRKSKNLVMLHPYDLTQPSFREYADFDDQLELYQHILGAITYRNSISNFDHIFP